MKQLEPLKPSNEALYSQMKSVSALTKVEGLERRSVSLRSKKMKQEESESAVDILMMLLALVLQQGQN